MNHSDTARVLTRIASVDQRTIGKFDVAAWHETIGHLNLEDCLEAVRRFFIIHTDRRILPADIVAGVSTLRAERLQRTLEPAPEDPDDVESYLRQLRDNRAAIAAAPEGNRAIDSTQCRDGPPSETAQDALHRARTACAFATAERNAKTEETNKGSNVGSTRPRPGSTSQSRDPESVSVSDIYTALGQPPTNAQESH